MSVAASPPGAGTGAGVVVGLVEEEMLGLAEDRSAVVVVSSDAGRYQIYQYRRFGAVVAEAPTLRLLVERITITELGD